MNLRTLSGLVLVFAFAIVPCTSAAIEADPDCNGVFQNETHRKLNLNAQKDLSTYENPNKRTLEEYDSIIGLTRRKIKSLVNLVPTNGLILDLGGGIGVAMKDLADLKKVTAININAQPPNDQVLRHAEQGQLIYQQGWAEEVLPTYEGQADVIVDIWGAFSYSPLKPKLLELIYAALKPGGKGYVLFHPQKTPAHVNYWTTGRYSSKTWKRLNQYLAEKYPDIFKTWDSYHRNTYHAKIIEISKPLDGPDTINLKLETTKTRLYRYPKNTFVGIELKESKPTAP